MRLLLDECVGDRRLRDALATAGHDVVRSVDAVGGGADDPTVFAFARQERRAVMTYNNADFIALAEQQPEHAGMLLIYQTNKANNMTTADIVRALANVEQTHTGGIAGQMVVLNQYRWARVERDDADGAL
jgi:predicted nuclease of predicted toxin-antitoxin system